MSASSPAAAIMPLFIPMARFREVGLPGRTKSYELARSGLLNVVKNGHGVVGVTRAEAERYFNAATPIHEAKRDTSRGVAGRQAKRAERRGSSSPTAGLPLGVPVRKPAGIEKPGAAL